ncbi:MAG: hypothetical protein H7067_08850, partial [Burkholderiales bacterium]|nr:hypothetical protein [Opitutaceae bacterium]
AQAAPSARAPEQIVIPAALAAALPPAVLTLARQLLPLDLQPAYQAGDAGRIYGMSISGWNIRWRHVGDTVEVVEATPRAEADAG